MRPTGSWAGQLDDDEFSLSRAVGGWRGVAESVVPGLVFVLGYVATRSLLVPLIASALPAVTACLVRLVQRQPLTQAFSGLVGVGIGVVWVAVSGRGENYFAWGLVTSGVLAVVLLASVVLRRPLVTEGVALVWELPRGWRTDVRTSGLRRRGLVLTLVWVALFAARLGVQWPLWRAAAVAELGIARLVMGLPLFALVCWATWVVLRPLSVLRARADGGSAGESPSGPDIDEGGASPVDGTH